MTVKTFFLPFVLVTELIFGCSNKEPVALTDALTDTTAVDGKTAHPIKEIPTAYASPASKEGNVVRINYVTNSYDAANRSMNKYAYVYLPQGYNENTRYNVFYLLHGGGGNAERYFNGEGQSSTFKRVLDHMIANKELEPLIVVTPSFYPNDNTNTGVATAGVATQNFYHELTKDLIPAVEGKYHTYAQSTTTDGLKQSRTHRAFGGFSMGSVATWYSFIYCLDHFKYFMPMSGDSWIIAQQGGASRSNETAEYLHNSVKNSGYKVNDFFIYALTGSSDIAYNAMNNQMAAMKNYPESFLFNEDFSKGNIYFNVLEGGTHTYEYIHRYIYNALPSFWAN